MSETHTVRKKNPERRRKRTVRLVLLLSFFLVTVASGLFGYIYVVNSDNGKNMNVVIDIPREERIAIDIPRGASTDEIVQLLEEKGAVRFPSVFKFLSKINGFDSQYKSGRHIISKELDYDKLMIVLSSKPETVKVMIPEGYSMEQMANLLSEKGLVQKEKFYEVAQNETFEYKFLEGLPKRDHRLEGYLFPDTYEFDYISGEKEIINRLLGRFGQIFKPDYYKKAEGLELTPDEVVVLASIIEREAKADNERRKIAGVFYNRLKGKYGAPKKLESCATIQYILYNKNGEIKTQITDQDTKIEHPYNTYQIEGLPPGPISNPGRASIEAALNPERHNYLYFVAKGDGTHHFSKTLWEHQQAVKRYQQN